MTKAVKCGIISIMNENELNKFLTKVLGAKGTKVNKQLTLENNIIAIRERAFLEYNCRFLYNVLGNLYGEEYAEKNYYWIK